MEKFGMSKEIEFKPKTLIQQEEVEKTEEVTSEEIESEIQNEYDQISDTLKAVDKAITGATPEEISITTFKAVFELPDDAFEILSSYFKDQFEKLQTTHAGRLHVIHVLDNAPMNWQGYSGLLNHDMLTKLFERIPDWGLDKTTYLMCGPEGMMKNVDTLLAARNIPKEKVFKESFVQGTIDKDANKEVAASNDEKKDREVTIRYDGQEYKIIVSPDHTILETALDQGIDLPYSCQSGLCTACRGKALSGKVKLDEEEGLSQSEKAEGYVLTCVGHPMTDDVVIEIG